MTSSEVSLCGFPIGCFRLQCFIPFPRRRLKVLTHRERIPTPLEVMRSRTPGGKFSQSQKTNPGALASRNDVGMEVTEPVDGAAGKVLVKFHLIQFELQDRRHKLTSAFYSFIHSFIYSFIYLTRGVENGASRRT